MVDYEFENMDITDFVNRIRLIQTIWQGCLDDKYSADYVLNTISMGEIDLVATLDEALAYVRVFKEVDEDDVVYLSQLEKVMQRMNDQKEKGN